MARSAPNLKKAPRRKIVDINRVGSWGRVEYEHRLDCGHVEMRKRAATTDELACAGCLLAAEHERRQKNERERLDRFDDDETILDPLGSEIAVSERDAARIRAGLAAKFGVSAEAVDVVLDVDDGVLRVSYAVVVLSADEVRAAISGA